VKGLTFFISIDRSDVAHCRLNLLRPFLPCRIYRGIYRDACESDRLLASVMVTSDFKQNDRSIKLRQRYRGKMHALS
jgi:hypothetical protein